MFFLLLSCLNNNAIARLLSSLCMHYIFHSWWYYSFVRYFYCCAILSQGENEAHILSDQKLWSFVRIFSLTVHCSAVLTMYKLCLMALLQVYLRSKWRESTMMASFLHMISLAICFAIWSLHCINLHHWFLSSSSSSLYIFFQVDDCFYWFMLCVNIIKDPKMVQFSVFFFFEQRELVLIFFFTSTKRNQSDSGFKSFSEAK